ncbi:HAD family hydrolase [Streptomyces daliensis]
MPIRAVLWDVDDTLFDYTNSDRAAALRHIETEGLLERYGSAEEALTRWAAVMEEQFGRFVAGELGFKEHRRERARAFLGTPLTDAEADAWFARYVTLYEEAWALFPDALPALDALTPGYRHGVLSNAATTIQERKLRTLGIRDRLELLLCADRVGHAKPAPEAFLAACEALRLPPGEVAYVGDRADIDALAAEAAGLRGVWLDRTGPEPAPAPAPASDPEAEGAAPGAVAPSLRITTLAELPALLTGLSRAS